MVRRRRKYELELESQVVVFENLPLFLHTCSLFIHSSPTPQGFSFRKKTAKKNTMTPSSASTEIHPDSIAAEVEMSKTEEEMPSVAPGDSDSYTNSLIDDESYESLETEDQTLQEWSMFPKILKLIATLKSTKNCNVDIKPEEIGDEWLDFVDKKIMPACKTSVACVDIDDETTVASTAASSYSENKTFEDEESQRQELVQEFTNVLKKNKDSAFVRSLIKKNPFMRSTVAA